MQNKSKKRWLDIQIILASIAVTSTVALWNLLSRGSRPAAAPVTPPPAEPTSTFTYTPTSTPAATATAATLDPNAPIHLPQVHLLLGGKLPVAPVVLAAAPSTDSANQNVGGSKGGGNNPNPAPPPPPPATNTGSSKP